MYIRTECALAVGVSQKINNNKKSFKKGKGKRNEKIWFWCGCWRDNM